MPKIDLNTCRNCKETSENKPFAKLHGKNRGICLDCRAYQKRIARLMKFQLKLAPYANNSLFRHNYRVLSEIDIGFYWLESALRGSKEVGFIALKPTSLYVSITPRSWEFELDVKAIAFFLTNKKLKINPEGVKFLNPEGKIRNVTDYSCFEMMDARFLDYVSNPKITKAFFEIERLRLKEFIYETENDAIKGENNTVPTGNSKRQD